MNNKGINLPLYASSRLRSSSINYSKDESIFHVLVRASTREHAASKAQSHKFLKSKNNIFSKKMPWTKRGLWFMEVLRTPFNVSQLICILHTDAYGLNSISRKCFENILMLPLLEYG